VLEELLQHARQQLRQGDTGGAEVPDMAIQPTIAGALIEAPVAPPVLDEILVEGVESDAPPATPPMLDDLFADLPLEEAPSGAATAESTPSSEPAGFAEVVGIDFGVCYSRLAVGHDEVVHIVPDAAGQRTCPSVIYYPERGRTQIGEAARTKQALEGERVVSSIKRVLGRAYSDPLVSGFLRSSSFRTSSGPGDSVLIEMGSERYAVPQVCAEILRHVRAFTSQRVGHAVDKAVLSHPVAFDEAQKGALKKAAEMAGLEVVDLIPEPVAVALAYGIGQQKNEVIAVYDFGGGTFDFTIVDMSHDHYTVMVTAGDNWLGGDDFDHAIADAIANSIWRRTNIEVRNRAVEWQILLRACEQAKRELSTQETTELRLAGIDLGAPSGDVNMPINREALQRLCQSLFNRSVEVCRMALSQLGLDPRDMTAVLVSGGTSHIPFIRDGLAQLFARPITATVNPEEAVALGAALHAAKRCGHPAKRAVPTP